MSSGDQFAMSRDRCPVRAPRQGGQPFRLSTPEVLVIENAKHPSSRRSKRVRVLLDKLADQAQRQGVAVKRYSREEVLTAFGRVGAVTKDDIALAVTRLVPELTPRLPKRRRIPWRSRSFVAGTGVWDCHDDAQDSAKLAGLPAAAAAVPPYRAGRRQRDLAPGVSAHAGCGR